MKIGDIALITPDNDVWRLLVKIEKLDYKKVKQKIKVGSNFFRAKYEEKEKQVLDKVWWSIVGDNTGLIHTKSQGTEKWDWEQKISNASIILNQAKQLDYEVINKKQEDGNN